MSTRRRGKGVEGTVRMQLKDMEDGEKQEKQVCENLEAR